MFENEYEKKNLATRLRESTGWTTSISDSIESLIVFPDRLLDNETSEQLYFVYGRIR